MVSVGGLDTAAGNDYRNWVRLGYLSDLLTDPVYSTERYQVALVVAEQGVVGREGVGGDAGTTRRSVEAVLGCPVRRLPGPGTHHVVSGGRYAEAVGSRVVRFLQRGRHGSAGQPGWELRLTRASPPGRRPPSGAAIGAYGWLHRLPL